MRHELGWFGRCYLLPIHSGIIFLSLPIIFNESDKSIYKIQINFIRKVFSILSIIFLLNSLFVSKEYLRRDFNANESITLSPYLKDYKLSKKHKESILKLREINKLNCKNESIFVFPWAPIIYTLLESKNPTRFDLPYHDMLTLREGRNHSRFKKRTTCCLLFRIHH